MVIGQLNLTISGQGPRLNFNNRPGDNLNSGRIRTTGIYSSPTEIMEWPLPRSFQSWSNGRYICSGLPLMVGAILAKSLRPIMAQGITWLVAAFWPPAFIRVQFEQRPSQGHSNLVTLKITTACTIAALLISLFFPPKC